jgi:hypothetical protein
MRWLREPAILRAVFRRKDTVQGRSLANLYYTEYNNLYPDCTYSRKNRKNFSLFVRMDTSLTFDWVETMVTK